MKKSLFFLFLFGSILTSQAQIFNFGIKVGAGSSHYSFNAIEYVNVETLTVLHITPYEKSGSWHLGAVASTDIGALPFSAKIAIQYTGTGAEVNILDGFSNSSTTIKETSGRVDIPLTLSYKISKLRLMIGLGYAIDVNRSTAVADHINGRYAGSNQIPFVVTSDQKNYGTYHFGIGLAFDKFTIDLLVDNPMNQSLEQTGALTYNFGPNPNLVQLSAGFYF